MQIDGMTQQNAGLVEDARRTAAGLQEQAEELTEAVAGFRLGAREFGSAEEAMAMVRDAVGFVQTHGRDALVAEINKLGRGRFIDRDLYLSAYAVGGRTVAHGTNRRLWNIDWTRFKDADGRLFIVDMVATANAAGRGWTDYKWVHPVSNRTLVKSAYFEKCGDLVIACGVFKTQGEAPLAQAALARGAQPALELLRA
jgi:signal transduction histidine kinase